MRRYAQSSAMRTAPPWAKAAVVAIPAILLLAVLARSSSRSSWQGGVAAVPAVPAAPAIVCDPEAEPFGCPEAPGHQGRRGCEHTGQIKPMSSDGTRGPYGALMISHNRETHASSLLALPNGDLLLTWFSGNDGQTEGGDGIAIVVAVLRKGEKQWTAPQVVSLEAGRSAQNPVLWYESASKRVHLYHTSQVAFMGQGTSEIRHLFSDNAGTSWSEPEAIFTEAGAFTRNQLLLGAGGELMMPMYFTPNGYGTFQTHYSALKISEDGGATWSQHNMTSMGEWLAQPSVVQLPGPNRHRLLAFFRDRRGRFIHSARSDDSGRTWTKAQRTKLPSNNSGIQAVALASGSLLIAFNNQQGGERWPLSVAISDDEAETWTWVRDIELGGHGERYGYPSVVQGPDGVVHLSYSYRRETIKYVAFTEEWVKASGSQSRGFFTGA